MGILDRFRKPSVTTVDPVFGNLTFKNGWWEGEVDLPDHAEKIGVSIETDERGPTDEHRRLFQELAIRYAGMRAGIGEALWKLYEPTREDIAEEFGTRRAGPDGASAMLASTALQGIFFEPRGKVELLFAFTPDVGWDDAMFSIGLEDWKPVPASLDD